MSSMKVIDIKNEEAKQEEAIEQPIEETKEEVNEVVEEPPVQETKEVIEEETKEIIQETKPVRAQDAKPCVKAQDKMVRCPKCNREMKYKKHLDTVINKDVRVVLRTNLSNPIQKLEQNLSLNK